MCSRFMQYSNCFCEGMNLEVTELGCKKIAGLRIHLTPNSTNEGEGLSVAGAMATSECLENPFNTALISE